ncbi:efflux RND transporter periplasmic adaptor subunit [Idiomarina xiamenensis]|uniref:RND family efflux transporter MFP subunit n=1 Tax=Idiomarina xiamenensis 10-D-4 TaxID=740709 RepID=K2KTG7_9GAMM|nr:efflux RND transporter periplasmic adaptor subunit [Idiomarina xiamenensis]EKE80930.1 RND family efflux transporter MFP subunit [Idiomarina xiamenensis 10-D-4]
MDTKRSTRDKWLSKSKPLALIVISALVLYWLVLSPLSASSSVTVSKADVLIGEVSEQHFAESISVRGGIAPQDTVYLDAVESGRVEQVLVEEGSYVEKGELIARLSNTSLQLDVVSREAQVTEQLNNLRNTRITMEQDRLSLQNDVTELSYQLDRISSDLARNESLGKQSYISEKELADLKREKAYLKKRLAIAEERQLQNELLRASQIDQMEQSTESLKTNLAMAKRSLDNLMVTAARSGYLTSLSIETGEFVQRGSRLGQIDDLEQIKVVANVDEYYLNRIEEGQTAEAQIRGKQHALRVDKVYPQVSSGRFKVDLVFSDDAPVGLSRGQSVDLTMVLGQNREAIVVPTGAYLNDTQGRWIFVLDEDGNAQRRNIEVGRRNERFQEVVAGLMPGERVILSSYRQLGDAQHIEID